jgi:murein DD-endopeptidase MepM/ murein hydrolase activator NlpD
VADISFDPKTWLSPGRPPAESEAPAASDSFDVRSWVDPGADAGPVEDGPPPRRKRPLAWMAAGLVGLGPVGFLAMGGWSGADESAAPAETVAAPPAAALVDAQSRTLVVTSPLEILAALSSAGVGAGDARLFADKAVAALGNKAGEVRLAFVLTEDNRLAELQATREDGSGIHLAMTAEGLRGETLVAHLEKRITSVRGEMDGDSFYTSAVTAGVTDSLIDPFADAFAFDFNFALEVKEGAVFEAAWEQAHNPSGQAVGQPTLLFVSLSTPEKSRTFYRFTAPDEEEAGWFDGNGRGTVRGLMLTPIAGARISSKFGPRFHPTLKFTRLHAGTDFAAPVGTPVYASGDANVVSATPTGCGGNMVVLQHDTGWVTRYFHFSRYAEGLAAGQRVKQGTVIGYVGNTGSCTTGPHLHYEVRIDGEPVDPMSIDTGTGKSLTGAALAAFIKERDRIDEVRAGSAT